VNIFLISPVAKADPETQKRIKAYVARLEKAGHKVHWPARDTKQDDSTGGLAICRTNFAAIYYADEIHIWYDETSGGSKFDMGGVFMLTEIIGEKKKIVIANEGEVADDSKKSFYKVMSRLAGKTK
jgi:hypothetical protein